MENKLVSVIVPVYNVESFLEHCVTSLLEQTYSNIEIILIDDGSTDSSGEMCDKWYEKDARIKVVHQRNKGLSAARNTGLDMAKGEYICFVDSDDFVTKEHIHLLVAAIEKTGSDFAFCDFASSKLAESSEKITSALLMTPEKCKAWLTNPISREYVLMVSSCNKLYKRDIFKDYRFEFGKFHEDEFLVNRLVFNTTKAVYLPVKSYVYRNNDESITGKENAGHLNHLHAIDAYEKRVKLALENGDEDFAEITFKWALLKLAKFYKDGSEPMKKKSMSMYIRLFDTYAEDLFEEKKYLKYMTFKKSPAIFCKIFRI